MNSDQEMMRGQRLKLMPVDDSFVDYEEMYDELFARSEQSVGAQLHPVKHNGGDE